MAEFLAMNKKNPPRHEIEHAFGLGWSQSCTRSRFKSQPRLDVRVFGVSSSGIAKRCEFLGRVPHRFFRIGRSGTRKIERCALR